MNTRGRRIEQKLDLLAGAVASVIANQITNQEKIMSVIDDLKTDLADLQAKAAAAATAGEHAITVMDALKAGIDTLTTELANAGVDTAALADIKSGMEALSATAQTQIDAFNARVAADTPPAPTVAGAAA